MKKSELIKLRKIYLKELERLTRIKELLNNKDVSEFVDLTKLNIKEYNNIDELLVLKKILEIIKITNTNNLYICTGNYELCSYPYASRLGRELSYDYEPINEISYKNYQNLESQETIRVFKDISEYNKYPHSYFTNNEPDKIVHPNEMTYQNFEKENSVITPINQFGKLVNYQDIRTEFFMNCINLGQEKSKKLLLEKYKRM